MENLRDQKILLRVELKKLIDQLRWVKVSKIEQEGKCPITALQTLDGTVTYHFIQEDILETAVAGQELPDEFTPSVMSWTPDKTGGAGCEFSLSEDGHTATFTGTIAYYKANPDKGREAGNRVGVMITPSVTFADDLSAMVITIGDKTYGKDALDEYEGKKVLWWYPLVTNGTQAFTCKIDWDGPEGIKVEEVFNVKVGPNAILLGEDTALDD